MIDPSLLGFAFGAGVATFFAPCAYPLLPGYVAYYLGTVDDAPAARRLGRAIAFALVASAGFVAVYVALAGVVVAVGAGALAEVSVLELVVGIGLVALGLATAAGRFDPRVHVPLPERRRSVGGFFAFGVAYAAAAAGCTGPVFVGVALAGLSAGPAGAFLTLGAYAAGSVLLLVAVTAAAALGRGPLDRLPGGSDRITRLAGLAIAAAGVVQVYFYLFRFDGLSTLGL